MARLVVILLLTILSVPDTYSQYYTNQNKKWAFGAYGGLDFSSGVPVPFHTSIITLEGSASVSNASGSLLFYTDGKLVYNRADAVMPSGNPIVPFLTLSTAQAALIVPVIGNQNQFYLFSLENVTGTGTPHASHLAFSIIDMTLVSCHA